jgi:CheY-like chemotaxis protein
MDTKLHVLVVEDEVIPAKILNMMLTNLGHSFDLVKSAEEALEMIENDYDVILMDIGLPGISGIDATREIRLKENKNKLIPIIAVTAFTDNGTKEQCFAVGMNAVAHKPLIQTQLEKLLKDI